ncbi:MAG: 16S rRNA (cytidine(1402)-2'-O)-methyltransferase [Candidatus Paceibacterota bacterium]|jgi:16S rRNA (cytidine1402-2'-O)-methyltransferase
MGELYLVATPIGNLEDITVRAVRILKETDLVLSEKPLVTKRLFDRYEIKTRLQSFHEHSEGSVYDGIIELLKSGKKIALVSEAGTPNIADPGGKLVQKVIEIFGESAKIIPIPGSSALTALLSVADFNVNRFLFLGFMPKKKGRKTFLGIIKDSRFPVVVYESVYRIKKFLSEIIDLEIEEIVLGRELTKKFETIYRGTPKQVLEKLDQDKNKGEFVVLINR